MENNAMAALKCLSLLYVEDDTETREELAMMLAPWVGALHVAADGQAGLDLFKAKRPDIVITDIQMPRVSGLAMSGEITRLVPDQPIVVISAFNDSEYLFRAIELGIDQYIPKPVNVERMLDKLSKMACKSLAQKHQKSNQALLEQYKYVVDQTALVCKLDLTGRITYVNQRLCEVSGFTALELLGHDLSELRENQERGVGWDTAISGTKWTGIVRNRAQGGHTFVVESSLVPNLDSTGQVVEITCMEVDITALHNSHESLAVALDQSNFSVREQRHFLEEYKRALELGTCVCVTDHHFNIISVNKQFELLLGYASQELLGLPITTLAPAISRDVLFHFRINRAII
jgi:PAS domain S-box-containing protein